MRFYKTLQSFTMTAVVFIAGSVGDIPQAQAVMQMRCSRVTVGYGDYTSVQDVCYWVYSGGGGGGGRGYAGGFRDVGGGGRSLLRTVSALNPDGNPDRATCESKFMERFAHANYDVKLTQASRTCPTCEGVYRTGQRIRVTYDDGGKETWVIGNPYFTEPLVPDPIPGTLKCPKGNI